MNSPEPMAIGSPTRSPGYPANSNDFLPQFLMGDPSMGTHLGMNSRNGVLTPQMGSRYITTGNSPPRNFAGQMLSPFNYQNMGPGISSLSRSYSMNAYDINRPNNFCEKPELNYLHSGNSPHYDRSAVSSSIFGNSMIKDKIEQKVSHTPGAPPLNRLADMTNKSSFNNLMSSDIDSRNKIKKEFYLGENSAQNLAVPNVSSLKLSPTSPAQGDAFYSQSEASKGDENLEDAWVTILGFPPSATSFVLQEFAQYGQILRHIPSTQGNWMHIQYQTKFQAQKALSKNGKILSDSLMVGVMPCIDKAVMNSYKPSSATLVSKSTDDIPKPINKNLSSGAKVGRTQSLRVGGPRPLGSFNRNGDAIPGSDGSHSNLPKKNTNVLSKAMEYMFGW